DARTASNRPLHHLPPWAERSQSRRCQLGRIPQTSRHPSFTDRVWMYDLPSRAGAATTLQEAHNATEQWEQPLLPAKYIEAGCGQCHLENQTGTPFLNQGRQLIISYGCTHCHTIKRPDGTYIVPDDDPPSLKHIGDKTTREWIYAWIKDPQAYAS